MPKKRLKITSFHKSAANSEGPNGRAAEGNSASSTTGFQIRSTSFYLIPTTELKKIVTGAESSSSSGSTCSYIGEKKNNNSDSLHHSATCPPCKTNASSGNEIGNCALGNISRSLLQSPPRRNSTAGSSGRANSPCSSTADPNDEEVDKNITPIRSNASNYKKSCTSTAKNTSECREETSRSTNSDLADSTIAQIIDYNFSGENSHSADSDLANSTISQAIDTWEDHDMTKNKKLLARKPTIVKSHFDDRNVMNAPRKRFYQDPVLNFQYLAQNSNNYIAPLIKPTTFNVTNHGHCKETEKFLASINKKTTAKTPPSLNIIHHGDSKQLDEETEKFLASISKKTTKKTPPPLDGVNHGGDCKETEKFVETIRKKKTTKKIAKNREDMSRKVYEQPFKEFQADIPKEELLPMRPHVPLQDGHPLIPSKTDDDPYERQIYRALKLEGTRHHFAVMGNVLIATMRSADIKGKRIESMPLGYHGMMCKYCRGGTSREARERGNAGTGFGRSGRYFPLSLKTMADSQKTLNSIYTHLTRCPEVPKAVKAAVVASKKCHVDDKNLMPRGSQQRFFRILWKRLHGVCDSKNIWSSQYYFIFLRFEK